MKPSIEDAFEARLARSADSETVSGPGGCCTERLRALEPPLLAILGCRSILDAPCSDFNWMRAVPLPISEADITAGIRGCLGSGIRYFAAIHGFDRGAFIACFGGVLPMIKPRPADDQTAITGSISPPSSSQAPKRRQPRPGPGSRA